MPHRRALSACTAAVLAAGALALAAPSGPAAADDPAPRAAGAASAVTSPGMLRAMERDLGLRGAQAERRLAKEREAGTVAGELRAMLSRSFAGAWLSGTADLTVATTDAAAADQVTAQGARVKVVPHTLAELDAAKEALDRAARRGAPAHTPVWYVDVRTNKVVLLSSRPGAARQFARSAGARADRLTVKKSSVKPRVFADLRGGDAFYIGGSRCSIGFSVTKDGGPGFVTAGHCGKEGATTTGANRQPQGTFRGSSFPGDDHAWVAANNDWTARAIVNGHGRPDQTVDGSTEAMTGASVCRSGSTTGWHCGRVLQRNTSVTYPQGTVSGLTRTNVCAEPGDSGGSFLAGNQAQGMTSGGSGNCSSGGTTYFQPVNEALQTYGLNLVTAGPGGPAEPGAPGEPETGGNTWAAGTVYAPGDVVTHRGERYRCLQGHQAQTGWSPPHVAALWQKVGA
jgi:streptogrisin C